MFGIEAVIEEDKQKAEMSLAFNPMNCRTSLSEIDGYVHDPKPVKMVMFAEL